ncbi:hypothetical protein [Arthrobacter sp. NPDC057013]|uniref:hypothetical protein n=1 Tax=Arthrobacter sp. NPDC057013 TaxID=3345999 RepID=UPI00364501DA
MSTPSDEPEPRDSGDVPPSGNERPTPGQRFPGQEPGQPFPGQQQPPAGGGRFAFEMPADRPRNFGEVLPRGGFSGLLDVTALPTELKVSYWIWVVGGLLGLLGGVIGLFGVLVLFAIIPGVAILVFLLVLVALALAAAEIVLALNLKEGKEWARLALTIAAGVSLLLAIVSSGFRSGQGGNWLGFLLSLVATVLMWVPNSQNWFAAARGRP